MARLKNVSGNDVSLFAQPGEANAYLVPVDEIVTVPGECSNADDQDADAYLIGEGAEQRQWPKSAWLLTKADEGSGTPRSGGRRTGSNSGGSADNGEG